MKIRISLSMLMPLLAISMFSCKEFIEIDAPKNSLTPASVFQNDALVISALSGIYQQMSLNGYASGDLNSIATICALTADEFAGHLSMYEVFYANQIIPENNTIANIWSAAYRRIYDSNALIEGLTNENGISDEIRNQVLGEAYFLRGFNYFYLVNLFGDIPLQLSANYRAGIAVSRSPVNEVYDQIVTDLSQAERLLNDGYTGNERVRANRSASEAMLSRCYLFLADWEQCEKYADKVINKGDEFALESLDQVFLKNSLEAVWQLMPPENSNTPAGNSLILLPGSIINTSLAPGFADAFEINDQRKSSWIGTLTSGEATYHYPYKYKVQNSATVTEYSMVIRLAEMYLNRAEARAHRSDMAGATSDLNQIRLRAGLPPIDELLPTLTKESLLEAIQKERQIELFSEWGHRWFDLKRTATIDSVLLDKKPAWKNYYSLFPIPVNEINFNQNITQNPGY